MNLFRLILAGAYYHRRLHAAVALGVAAATAVLTGALVVGDSVRGSLRHLALDRLQRIDEILVVPRFFRVRLADELSKQPEFARLDALVVPAIVLEGTIEEPATHARASQVNLFGVEDRCKSLTNDPSSGLTIAPASGEIVINAALADDLKLTTGKECLVRLPIAREVPADSPLGRKTETVTTLRLRVAAVMPNGGLGGLALRPNQAFPRNAYLSIADIQKALGRPDEINAIFVAREAAGVRSTADLLAAHDRLQSLVQPTLADHGLSIRETPAGYSLLESDRMLLDPAVSRAARRAFEPLGGQPVFTYLANTLANGQHETPYSTIAALDFGDEQASGAGNRLQRFINAEGQQVAPLGDDEIALNAWAAEDLDAKIGDTIRVTFFEPESTHAQVRERTVELRLAAIVALAGAAADPHLTPELPGVTDQLSISAWNPPFPFDNDRIRAKDEKYWDDHRATPKAFVSLATGRTLWGSRFGDTTSWRIPDAEGRTIETLSARLKLDAREMGFEFQPVRARALAASAGTTPFEMLFLGFSMFIIAAAVLLVAILFRLNVDGRAAEIGVLLATGWRVRRVRRLWLAEGALVAAVGASVGLALAIGYAWLMLAALRTVWLAAISAPFVSLHVSGRSLLIGAAVSLFVSLAVIILSLARLRRQSVRGLLANRTEDSLGDGGRGSRAVRLVAVGALVLAIAAALAASGLSAEAQAAAFFGSASLVLVALLAFVLHSLKSRAGGALIGSGRRAIWLLAWRNAARHALRSTLTIGLIAAASFLIIATSAFRLDPNGNARSHSSGTGGFALVATSAQPIYQDLNMRDGRQELGFTAADEKTLADTDIYALRMVSGDDASCLNLYQTAQPRVLGVPASFVERGGFAFSGVDASAAWSLLDKPLPPIDGQSRVPVILDEATARYSLHLRGVGDTFEMLDGNGQRIGLQVVALLKNSILQGSLLVAEEQLLKHFPETSGYRFFLIDAPPEDADRASAMLEGVLADLGFDAESAPQRLAEFSAVQNTYLATFQSLGALGLLLGTLGLAAVQLRNVIERRGELALLQAVGFRRALVARLVLAENALLLVIGLAIGAIAALVATLPHLILGGASLPWLSLSAMLLVVLLSGLAASTLAVRTALREPIVATLRGE